jgi:hypothetical protein
MVMADFGYYVMSGFLLMLVPLVLVNWWLREFFKVKASRVVADRIDDEDEVDENEENPSRKVMSSAPFATDDYMMAYRERKG